MTKEAGELSFDELASRLASGDISRHEALNWLGAALLGVRWPSHRVLPRQQRPHGAMRSPVDLLITGNDRGPGSNSLGPTLVPLFTGGRGSGILRIPLPLFCIVRADRDRIDPIVPTRRILVNTTCCGLG